MTAQEWDLSILGLIKLWLDGKLSDPGIIEAIKFLGPRPVTP
jgi:hypothetical protein